METSTLYKIKRTAARFIEPQLLTGLVLEVRYWEPATIIEIDLHLPNADMSQWLEVPYIKFKVAPITFRDYTPSCWDAETRTCTLFIDAAHQGEGSKWAQRLQKGLNVEYLKIGTSHHAPASTPAIVALGDQSSLAHLLALQQMVLPATRFSGAILFDEGHHQKQFNEYFSSPLQPITKGDTHGHHSLVKWVADQRYTLENVVFYLAGNNSMVAGLRKLLKYQGYASSQIKVQGFWS